MLLGVDFGTMFLVIARKTENGTTLNHIRNVFMDVDNTSYAKKMLEQMKVSHAESKGRLLIVGEPAFELANLFRREVHRPMKDGVINPEETDAIPVIRLMIESLVGSTTDVDKRAVFNYPADPVDAKFNVAYHRRIIDGILTDLGYKTQGIHEGFAVVLSELANEDFTGIGVSFGAGMCNISVAYKGMEAVSLSSSKSGDFIDSNAAMAVGSTVARMTKIKEYGIEGKGMDLQNPKNRDESAIAIFYRELIQYTFNALNQSLKSSNKVPEFKEPVQMVVAGGTAKIGGFVEELKKNIHLLELPVKDIRLASEPLGAIAKGDLVFSAL